ncbi:MAG: DNA polymerase IV [Treponema sp.]|nr:DNA polymerase IV [Treponema sp.]
MPHWYLHVDLDAFFASVEELDNPQYRGKPLIVGGKPEDRRSVVSTASYAARKYGVHSAMPTFQAYKLCPQGIFVYPRMERYAELSYKIMNIFRDFSPDVDQMSIDEAFIDLTGTERLFGPPEKTALKIKARVKEETGLTVSVGLASTKYLAKIASGFSKPDGFYYIHAGDEENFMLNLPLNKVWGLGPKSLELLHSKGIKSTRDIYEKPYEILEFLFGKNMASFLHEVVRGREKDSFTRKPKSHSISAENTFPYDLTDIYGIETELMEIAHGVYFRLLKEEAYSRTAFVKIRYEDFSTTTIQETLDHNISSLDSYFQIIKGLFEKKYIQGRGIRLLGVGFENITKEEKPYQQDLFANNDEKKQTVEKAILKLQKKHPEIKINKARTIKNLALLFFCLFISGQKLQAQSQTVNEKGAAASNPDIFYEAENKTEAPESLFNWQINDTNNVEFLLSGYWKLELTETLSSSFGQSTPFAMALGVPLFKQEIDLSAWVFLNKHWYFEADFADEFKKNTLALGYVGQDFVRSLRLSNRSIALESDYSADAFGFGLKGGENQAPGIVSHMQSSDDKLELDFLARYDMTKSKSASFYGMNSVQDKSIAPEAFMYGYSYRFPDESQSSLSAIKNIYVENKNGAYKDSEGRSYKKLSNSDYIYIASSKMLYLSENAKAGRDDSQIPAVLISFTNNSYVTQILTATGSYSDSSSFAGQIQALFSNSQTGKNYNLSDYTPNLSTTIEGDSALLIQSPTGFSPYLCPNTYDGGLETEADILIVDSSSDTTINKYIGEETDLSMISLYEDFFNEKHLYAKIINKNLESSIYPFIEDSPEIYLNLTNKSNIKITLRTYKNVSEYYIGRDIVAGSVIVYKNNIIDTTAKYDSESGTVSLSTSPSASDKIYITWQEDASDYSRGAFTGGAGIKYHFTDQLTGDAFLSARWPLIVNTNYSSIDDLQRGFAALSGGINYQSDNFSISNKTSISLQKDNAAQGLLVSSQENNNTQTYYLESGAAYTTKVDPVISNAGISLSQENNETLPNHTGSTDSTISGYKIPLSWDFSENSNGWAAVDIHLAAGNLLKNSSKLNLALKADITDSSAANSYDVYLQLGVKASDQDYGEDTDNIPSWKLEDFDLSTTDWQTVSITLEDKDRARLVSAYDARLIVLPSSSYNQSLISGKGSIYAGPYEPVVESINVYNDEELIVSNSSSYKSTNDYSSLINWILPATTEITSLNDSEITAISYFDSADFSSYQNIKFIFAINAGGKVDATSLSQDKPGFTLILDKAASDYQENGDIALKLEIDDISDSISESLTYHTLTINTRNRKVFIDDRELSSSAFNLYLNSNIAASRQKLLINIVQGSYLYRNGSFYVNRLTYNDTDLYFKLQNKLQAEYKKEGSILDIKDYELLKDFHSQINASQTLSNLSQINFNASNYADAGITLAGIILDADANLENTIFSNAGHSIKTENPIFNFLSLEENYRYSKTDSSLKKDDKVTIDFTRLNFPYSLSFSSQAQDQFSIRSQKLSGESKLDLQFSDKGSLKWKLLLDADQKIKTNKNNLAAYNYDNYFIAWYDISSLQFSTGYDEASQRKVNYKTNLEASLPFAGFKPYLEYSLKSSYQNSDQKVFTDTGSLILKLPFNFDSQSLTFSIERNAGATNYLYTGSSYLIDSQELFLLQEKRAYLYTEIPFYELFEQDLKNKITGQYAGKYQLSYKRQLFNNIKDLFLPANASLSVIRNINNQENYSDLYQFKTVITNTSLNNFGSLSKGKYFTWFKHEEIITNLTGLLKVPVDLPENTSFQLTAYLQILFMIKDNARLTTALDASISTDLDWSGHGSLIYTRPGKSSFITDLVKWLIAPAREVNFKITRKDILNIEISRASNKLSQKYSISHNMDFSFLDYFTITSGIGAGLNLIEGSSNSLSLNLSIGAKAEF